MIPGEHEEASLDAGAVTPADCPYCPPKVLQTIQRRQPMSENYEAMTPTPRPVLSVELPLDWQTGPDTTMLDMILDRAAWLVMDKCIAGEQRSRYDNDDQPYWVSVVRGRVEAIRTAIIREKLEPLITDELERPLTPVQAVRYGQPEPKQGERTTLADLVRAETADWLRKNEPVDRYNSKAEGTKLQQIIRAEVNHILAKEFAKELEAGKAEVRAALRAQGAALLADTIERMKKP